MSVVTLSTFDTQFEQLQTYLEKTPELVVSEVNEIIKNKKGGDVVDWLSLVAEKNDMNRFFDY